MKINDYVGKTIAELAKQTSIFWHPVHVFVLENKHDTVGKRLMDAYSLQQVIDACPATATATVIYAKEIQGDTVLRIRVQEEEAHE